MKIGLIGLGIMGKPMAKNLLKAGYELVVNDRNQASIDEVVAAGASYATQAEIGESCDVVLTMLPNSPQVKEVMLGDDGVAAHMKAGSTFIDMSSINPVASKEIAAVLEAKGIDMLDAPVSGGEPKAIDGTLSFMVGGKQEVFDPLGMKYASYCPNDYLPFAATELDPITNRYICGEVHDENARFLNGVSGNAGIFATMDDLTTFAHMLVNEGKEYLSSEPIYQVTGCEAGTEEIWINPVLHTILLMDSGSNGWDLGSKVELYYMGASSEFTMRSGAEYTSTFNFGPTPTEGPKEIVVDDSIGSIDNIPKDVTKLTFKEGSFNSVTSVVLDFPYLKTLIFENNTFINTQYIEINAPLLEELIIGENCFSGLATTRRLLDVSGRFVLNTPALKTVVIGTNSMQNINTVVLTEVSVDIQFDLSTGAMSNVNLIEYRVEISIEVVIQIKISIENNEGHEGPVDIEPINPPTTQVPTT